MKKEKTIQIRQNVFETNSSSTHSISIAEGNSPDLMDTSLMPDQNGIISLHGGEFGWSYEKYNDARTKANYLAQALTIIKGWKETQLKEYNDFFKEGFGKLSVDYYESMLEKFTNVLKAQTGCDNVVIVANRESGYIDHQSIDDTSSASFSILTDTEEAIRQFIFNKNSWLFTGNDNSPAKPNFYDVPVIKNGKMVVVKYKFELKIEGLDDVAKFKDKPNEKELHDAVYALCHDIRVTRTGHIDANNSIMAQMMRNDNECFKYDYNQEIKDGIIRFIKDTWHDASTIYKERFPKDDWTKDNGYKKTQKIEKELMKKHSEKYVRTVAYTLTEI